MKVICGPETLAMPQQDEVLQVILYGQPTRSDQGSAGATAKYDILRQNLHAAPRAWDLLSIALSVVTADHAGLRDRSPDGWTREFELTVAVNEPDFWTTQTCAIEAALAFLTTDRWQFTFIAGGLIPTRPQKLHRPDEDCIVLLSGGLDSLIGLIDLVEEGARPLALSQVVRGDAEKQAEFAHKIGGGIRHLQLNHNAHAPGTEEASQRARSLIFIAFGVLAATTLARYDRGDRVPCYVCENGFIALNPPLTGSRIGSLSTRTAHPEFLARIQGLLDASGLRVRIDNPYRLKTKGEMMLGCLDQDLLKEEAARSTSCGRFQRFNYHHCGRCVPCQVRRAAFLSWQHRDATIYIYEELGQVDSDHAGFDDVRAAAMAIAEVRNDGLDAWLGSALSMPTMGNVADLRELVERGLAEIAVLHEAYGVR
jgi:7-cyano-7-deazaguanine synthase in queuosine biosynthesis